MIVEEQEDIGRSTRVHFSFCHLIFLNILDLLDANCLESLGIGLQHLEEHYLEFWVETLEDTWNLGCNTWILGIRLGQLNAGVGTWTRTLDLVDTSQWLEPPDLHGRPLTAMHNQSNITILYHLGSLA
ncbi:hypothetical protein ACTA71_005030 [Dictyostelium dimigraforme]